MCIKDQYFVLAFVLAAPWMHPKFNDIKEQNKTETLSALAFIIKNWILHGNHILEITIAHKRRLVVGTISFRGAQSKRIRKPDKV